MNEHYQVLARKYRPHTFEEMVGQAHTIKTLVNALNTNQLHHAFLFTGTRGVGKTTIARIFAKSINCEQGVSAKPCGQCFSCTEIDQGQSIDLIELDAASHTGVDNMRDILENAQYMPTKSRYKVYLIDEVHMLSKSSFNALLKTLEEPPEHIKFLLATTTPEKLPITILSRCLQFTLQKLTQQEIIKQLTWIMQTESLQYEESALQKIASSAQGSMRDALSLLDQSIAYGNGSVTENDIKAMLGLVHQDDIITLATHLLNQDVQSVIDFIQQLSHKGENLPRALQDLASLFHQISIAKSLDNNQISNDIQSLANKISSQDVQLFYHMAIHGTQELLLAPSESVGFEMILLKMLTFRSEVLSTTKNTEKKTAETNHQNIEIKKKSKKIAITSQQQWEACFTLLKFSAVENTLLKNTLFESFHKQILILTLDKQFKSLLTDNLQHAIQKTLQKVVPKLSLRININTPNQATLAQKETQEKKEKLAKIQAQFLNHTTTKKLEQVFNKKININSIKGIH